MPFQSPALEIPAAVDGEDNVEVQLIIQPVVKEDGSYTATIILQTRHYRTGADGRPVYVGNPKTSSYIDIFALVQTDADVAAAVSVIFPALGAFVAAKQL